MHVHAAQTLTHKRVLRNITIDEHWSIKLGDLMATPQSENAESVSDRERSMHEQFQRWSDRQRLYGN